MTYEEAVNTFEYVPKNGTSCLVRKYKSGIRKYVGTLDAHGYYHLTFNYKTYFVHRVVWLLHHGSFPPEELDHLNRTRVDNRIENLRLASRKENSQNSRRSSNSGAEGVHFNKRSKKYRTHIKLNKKQVYLGSFNSPEEAHAAYRAAKIEHHLFYVQQ